MVKKVTLYKKHFFIKSQYEEAGTNFVLLCHSGNMVG